MVSNDFFHPHGPLSDNRYFWYFSYFSNYHYFCNFINLLRTAVYGKIYMKQYVMRKIALRNSHEWNR